MQFSFFKRLNVQQLQISKWLASNNKFLFKCILIYSKILTHIATYHVKNFEFNSIFHPRFNCLLHSIACQQNIKFTILLALYLDPGMVTQYRIYIDVRIIDSGQAQTQQELIQRELNHVKCCARSETTKQIQIMWGLSCIFLKKV